MVFLISTTSVQYQRKKEAELRNFFECDYCALSYPSKNEQKVHTMNHFQQKCCLDCNKLLIEICGDWYELHVASNCNKQNNSYNCNFGNNKEEDNNHSIIQELEKTIESSGDFSSELMKANAFTYSFDEVQSNPFILNFDAAGELRNILELSPECAGIRSDVRTPDHLIVENDVDKGANNLIKNISSKSSDMLVKVKRKKKRENPATKKKVIRTCARAHIHRPKGKVACDICGKVLSNYFGAQRHIAVVHYPHAMKATQRRMRGIAGNNNNSHVHRPKSNVFCDICKKVFKSLNNISIHMKTVHHPKEARVSCEICNQTYANKRHLEIHMYSHKLVKPHMCSYCGKGYVRLKHLLLHERVHKGIRPFTCQVCGKTFYTNTDLLSHMKTHSDERPFKCDFNDCEWSFKHSCILKRHKARAHGLVKNKFPCPICSKEFPESLYHLKRHLQQAHKKYGD